MKKLFMGVLFGVLLLMVVLSAGANTKGAPVLTYVYSNSMEPTIRVNDGFLIWPSEKYNDGDIIMYRPMVLKASFITHRIIGRNDNGYITQGDNSPYIDQESGEPAITRDRIVGKVLTLQGKPIIFPGLGKVAQGLRIIFGRDTKYLSMSFFALGILTMLIGNGTSLSRRKPRRRLRLHQIYRFITILATTIVMVSMYFGSRVTRIEYLVSEYPGTLGDQVKVKQLGQLTMEVKNKGFIPVWSILDGILPIQAQEPARLIGARSDIQVYLQVLPQVQTGKYIGYVQGYSYPTLLPRQWVTNLHRIHPSLAILATGLMIGLLFKILFIGVQQIPGFEGWIPIKAIQDKMRRKKLLRLRAKLLKAPSKERRSR